MLGVTSAGRVQPILPKASGEPVTRICPAVGENTAEAMNPSLATMVSASKVPKSMLRIDISEVVSAAGECER